MKLKALAKVYARNNGGDIDKARRILEERRREVKIHNFEYVFLKNFKEVKVNER
jgi:hypothetical protein